MTVKRDYSKFLHDDGRLNTRYLPRDVYTALVKEYRSRDAVIDEVFERLYLSWDLEEELKAQRNRGEEPDRARAAEVVLESLEDTDWWRVTSAFEKALIRDFRNVADNWSEQLDRVYDDQEAHGWRDLQG